MNILDFYADRLAALSEQDIRESLALAAQQADRLQTKLQQERDFMLLAEAELARRGVL